MDDIGSRAGIANKPVPKEAVLVVNTRSRRGEKLFRHAVTKLTESGIDLIGKHPIKDPEELTPTVRKAVREGAPMVIIGGGDGSLSCAVEELVDRDCVFALLPLGTANSFARTLGIPIDLDGAIQVIATGKRRRIDLGKLGGDYFTNASSIGLSALIGCTIPHNLKRYLGRPGYLMWALWCLARFKSFNLTVEGPDGKETLRALEVRIANGPFHGGIKVVDGADVDNGVIVVEAVSGRARTTLISNWVRLLVGLSKRERQVKTFRAKRMKLSTSPELPVSTDGEVMHRTPVTVEVAERAVDVVVPA